jgi:dihydrofolate synthase/folylpolyglutamate synthase
MSPEEFAAEWEHLQPFLDHVDAMGMGEVTYFEAVTALAFLWMADKPVGLGVIEVGMGGSWDATNLVAGDVAIVTPIGMDHVAELGPTLTDIAGEKAGIIKEGRTAVIRQQDPEAAVVLARRADEVEARLLREGADWEIEEILLAVGGQSFRLRTPRTTYEDLYVPLHGDYAAANAAAGVVAFETLTDRPLDEDALREGLGSMRAPGRLEVVVAEPLLVLDGAHNPDGAVALAEAFARAFRWGRLHLVIAVSANKDVAGVVAPLAALADTVHAARNDSVRSAGPEEVAVAARAAGAAEVTVHGGVAEALAGARAAAQPGDAILVTGSLFTVADAKRALSA